MSWYRFLSAVARVIASEEARPEGWQPAPVWGPEEEAVYRDLRYTQFAWFVGEQIWVYWETIYALIAGGLVAAFFALPPERSHERLFLCAIGAFLASVWACVVARYYLYSDAREDRCKTLEKTLSAKFPVRCEAVRPESAPVTVFDMLAPEHQFVMKRARWFRFSGIDTTVLRKWTPRLLLVLWLVPLLLAFYTARIRPKASAPGRSGSAVARIPQRAPATRGAPVPVPAKRP